jgi:DNA-binding SARP family transcriptional activator
VAIEPLRESAHRRVIAVHVDEGNLVQAIRQYRAYQQLLDDELSMQPTAQLRALRGPLLWRDSG